MDGGRSTVEQARDAAGRSAWQEVYTLLHACDPDDLEAQDLEALADAAWWLCHVEESLEARQQAYASCVAAGDGRRAAYNAWWLSSEYHFIGRPSLSTGWLRRAQRQLGDAPECVETGLVAFSECEQAEARGDVPAALDLASRVVDIGRRCGSRDLAALGMATQGRLLIACNKPADGIALLDEAMLDVTTGELDPAFTGWVYCLAVAVCFDIADLRRASEWNDAAMAWCRTLPAGTPFHGLCRVHHVELIGLGGDWAQARAEAERACDELMAYHPNMAGDSFYVAGEIRRRMGDLADAEQAFMRAHELGREPQPGLALLRLTQGRVDAAAAALRSALADTGGGPLRRARLLSAQVEVALAAGELDAARAATGELEATADASRAVLLEAMAATARGAVELALRDALGALEHLRRACRLWLDLELPYETAQARMLLATACLAVDDDESARLEARAARSVFQRLGSPADMRRADDFLFADARGVPATQPDAVRLPANLTEREVEVLRLVAAGKTNREIAADLVLSPHTVARHLNNIFAKLGVSSRAAATAFAYSHDLVTRT